MKKIRLAVLAAVVCTAALLTSCIKEESYEVDMAQLDVTFDTRADEEDTSGSQQQGDGIQDVMLWAFKCTLNSDGTPTGVTETATGWRHVQNVNANGSLTNIHLPLPICGDDISSTASQSYVVVAVINTEQFGTTSINGGFSRTTTYTDLTTGTFDASGTLFWGYRPDDEDLVPEDMPVSSWATITVTNANTHAGNCYQLELPVYRAVAKTQLYVRKTSSAFGLAITDAKVISSKALNKGYILSKCSKQYNDVNDATLQRGWIDENTVTPLWWSTPSDYAKATVQLCNSTIGGIEGSEGGETDANLKSEYLKTPITEIDDYTWVGSAFLYENNAEEVVVKDDYTGITTDNGGYYMAITYVFNRNYKDDNGNDLMWNENGTFNDSLDGNETVTRYVPLPKIVRNHDYRVNATVDVVVNGKLKIIYEVTDWTPKTVNVPEFE